MGSPQPVVLERDPRRTLYAHVRTSPALVDCWSMNVSASGMALSLCHAVGEVHAEIAPGTVLNVEFNLPDGSAAIEATGRVVWRQEMTAPSCLLFGLSFVDIAPEERARLSGYVAECPLEVAVLHASDAQRQWLETLLAPSVTLRFMPPEASLARSVTRGDLSVLLICGASPRDLQACLAEAASAFSPQFLPAILAREAAPRLIYLGPAEPQQLVAAFNEGALFSAWPADPPRARLRDAIINACQDVQLARELRRIVSGGARPTLEPQKSAHTPRRATATTTQMIATSACMQDILDALSKVAARKVSVLLQGETGTGKGVLARALHEQSDRANEAFVIQDCGTLPEMLLESELFGHMRGSFTGAVFDHPGLFVTANGGTIFLDEIENTTPRLQASLLRVIETGELRAIGSRTTRRVDVRIIAASNKDLEEEVKAGRFRADLYYRLNTFPIVVPPLRDRVEDILPLAKQFLGNARSGSRLSPEVERLLVRYAWPGNIRELKNAIERANVLADERGQITPQMLPASVRHGERSAGGSFQERVERFERELIAQALERNDYNLSRTAQALGLNRMTLSRKVARCALHKPTRA